MYKFEKWAREHLDVVWDSSPPELYARCPFKANHRHGDQTPSFGINVQKGVYVCHGCQEKGTFDHLAKVLKVRLTKQPPSPAETLSNVQRLRTQEAMNEVQAFPESWLDQFTVSHRRTKYWRDVRGISIETIEEWQLGYDRGTNSATIPLKDFHGRVLGVIRRRLDQNAKPRYVYPRGFKISQHLWGAWQCKGEDVIAITEGSVDALACWDAHIPAVALLGSHISKHQVTLLRKLSPRKVVLMTDRDSAGIEAARQVRASLQGMVVSIGTYKEAWKGKDPADLDFRQRRAMLRDATLLSR